MAHNIFSVQPFTPQMAERGEARMIYHLNGGGKVLAKLVSEHADKDGRTTEEIHKSIGMASCTYYGYRNNARDGISLLSLRRFSKLLGVKPYTLGRKLHLKAMQSTRGKAGVTRAVTRKLKSKPKAKKQTLDQIMESLGVGQPELACSVVIGEDRLTVERMKGQTSQPVVVEHNGHRLTIEKA